MKLPNAENAFIDDIKLTDYCLNPNHPVGKHKAKLFKNVLSITRENYYLLKNIILEEILNNPAKKTLIDKFGKRYTVNIKLDKFRKKGFLVTAWIIRNEETFPRLTSCYIKK